MATRLERFFSRLQPVLVVGGILTIACFALFIVQPAFVKDVSNNAYDIFMNLIDEPPKSGSVVIVDLDERSLETYGQWPWYRWRVADLTRAILDAGAAVLAFDVVFPEKDRTSPALVQQRLNERFKLDVRIDGVPPEYEDFDRIFADVISNRHVVLGCELIPSDNMVSNVDYSVDPNYQGHVNVQAVGGGAAALSLRQASSVKVSIPELTHVARSGFFNAMPDEDGTVRSCPLVWMMGQDRYYPAMSLEAVWLFKGQQPIIVRVNDEGVERVSIGKTEIPTDASGRMVLNYRTLSTNESAGFVSSFPVISAGDILSGSFDPDMIKGKIVFVGTSAVGLKDIRATPLTQFFSGVEVHATMVDNILSGDMLSDPSYLRGAQAMLIVLTGILLTVLVSRGRSWLSLLVSILFILFLLNASVWLLTKFRLVYVPVWEVLVIAVMHPLLTTIKFWQEEMQKKKVREMFGTMVSESVLHYLENNPGSFSLSGRKAEATMFFSDVAKFTTISESLPPDKLSLLLNKYLSPMTDIIMRRNGYVDKYEGDLIMAEWGVPYAVEDHAVQACMAALEQQETLQTLRPILKSEFGHDICVRMGLNSGMVTAGNMGSDRKFQYTVLGDAVNMAARLEPVNKDYGTLIVMGESTYKGAQEHIEARLLDKVVVMGKTQPVGIYELVGRKGEVKGVRFDVIRIYEDALRLHWERKWKEARALIQTALELDPGDGPCGNLNERIMWYQIAPPPEGWQGEFTRSMKD